jgi:rod shape-determining protein MreD
MRWFRFFILAYIALGLQAGLSRAIEYKSASPDFVLLTVVFLAINAPRDTALLACFILGALHDFTGQGTLGLLAFSYGLAAVFIVAIQQAVNRRHPLTGFILTLFAGITVAVIISVHGLMRPPEPAPHQPVVYSPMSPLFYSAIYSAILALILLPVLQKIRAVFHFQTGRGRV